MLKRWAICSLKWWKSGKTYCFVCQKKWKKLPLKMLKGEQIVVKMSKKSNNLYLKMLKKSRKTCSWKCCTRVRAWLRSTIICLRGRVCPSFLPLFCLCSLFISNIRYKVRKEKKRGIWTNWDKKSRNGRIAQPILLILNQQKTDVIRNRISIQMALR